MPKRLDKQSRSKPRPPLRVEHLELGSIKPARYNPRSISPRKYRALKASIKRYGFVDPIVVNRRNGNAWGKGDRGLYCVGGHQRLKVAEELGIDPVPCSVVELGPEDERVVNLALNNPAGEFDELGLAKTLEYLEHTSLDLEPTGFSEVEVARALQHLDHRAGTSEEADKVPPLPKKPTTETGDLLKIGPHRLLCGDATDLDQVLRLVGKLKVAAVVTDPPYAIYGSASGVSSEVTDDRIVRPFFEQLFRTCEAVLPWFGHAYVFCDWRSWPSLWEMAKRTRMVAKNLIVWDKGGQGLGNMYANCYECVGFFAKLPAPTTMLSGKATGERTVNRPNMQRFDRPRGDARQHNAAKPVDLLVELIRNSTDKGDVVLDPFIGSGSTLIACERLGRLCVAIDIEPRYCDVVRERFDNRGR
jgi:DNA modification methylase